MDFEEWYEIYSRAHRLNPDPLDLRHQYDYEEAFNAGVREAISEHLPSRFKGIGHPRRFIKGIDTVTGKKGKIEDMMKNVQIQLLIDALFEERK